MTDEDTSVAFGEPVLYHLLCTRQRTPGRMPTIPPSVISWTASRRTRLRNAARGLTLSGLDLVAETTTVPPPQAIDAYRWRHAPVQGSYGWFRSWSTLRKALG